MFYAKLLSEKFSPKATLRLCNEYFSNVGNLEHHRLRNFVQICRHFELNQIEHDDDELDELERELEEQFWEEEETICSWVLLLFVAAQDNILKKKPKHSEEKAN